LKYAPADINPPATPSLFPEPPQQHAAWTPQPTALPESFETSVKTLFDAGLPDPRGCEYREIEIKHVSGTAEPVAQDSRLAAAQIARMA